MPGVKFKQTIFDILNNLKGIVPLKELFWGELIMEVHYSYLIF